MFGQIRVANSSGFLGVGTSNPQTQLHVYSGVTNYSQAFRSEVTSNTSVGFCVRQTTNGNSNDNFFILGTGWCYSKYGVHCSSDSSLKTNIFTISDPINKILSLRGISFTWKPITTSHLTDTTHIMADSSSNDSGFTSNDSGSSLLTDTLPHYGFIAQEVEDSFPNHGMAGIMPNGLHGIAYDEVIPLLVEAMKAQQVQLNSLLESYGSCGNKSNFEPGGCAEFTKGDVLNVTTRYTEAISDPSSDATRLWLSTIDNKSIRYWDNQSTPEKQTIEIQSNKNSANGYAGLDGSYKLSGAQQLYGTTSNTACQGNDSRLSDSRESKLNYYDNTTHTGSSTTSEEIMAIIRIPGGTLGANDVIEVRISGGTTNNANNKTFRLRWNNTTSLGGTILASRTISLCPGISGNCNIVMKNSTSSQEVNPPNSVWDAEGITGSAFVTASLSISSDIYIILTTQKSNASDTISIHNYQIKILKP